MISATIVQAGLSAGAMDAGAQGSSVSDAQQQGEGQFLQELQAALALPQSLVDAAVAAADEEALDSKEEDSKLQNLPEAQSLAILLPAIFADQALKPAPEMAEGTADAPIGALSAAASQPSGSDAQTLAIQEMPLPDVAQTAVAEQGGQEARPTSLAAAMPAAPGASMPSADALNLAEVTQVLEPVPPVPVSATPQTSVSVNEGGGPSDAALRTAMASQASALPTTPVQSKRTDNLAATEKQTETDAISTVLAASVQTIDPGDRVLESASASQHKDAEDSATQAKVSAAAQTAPAVEGALQSVDTSDATSVASPGLAAIQTASETRVAAHEIGSMHRTPLEPHQMRLDSGPVQVEVLKLVRQGGGQIQLELTPPDQGSYRVDLRLDGNGKAVLVVEGASESVRTRMELTEGGLREQLSQMGLQLQLNYRQHSSEFASDERAAQGDVAQTGSEPDAAAAGETVSRTSRKVPVESALVHLYA